MDIASLEPLGESSIETKISCLLVDNEYKSKLPYTPENVKFLCYPTEVTSLQKVNQKGTQLSLHLECQFEALCNEFKNIFS